MAIRAQLGRCRRRRRGRHWCGGDGEQRCRCTACLLSVAALSVLPIRLLWLAPRRKRPDVKPQRFHVEMFARHLYATPMREPTQAECFAYDVWNKSCPGALNSLATLALGAAGTLVLLSVLAACHKGEKAASRAVRPVRTVTAELQEGGRRYR